MRSRGRAVAGVAVVAVVVVAAIAWLAVRGDREVRLSLKRISAVDSRVPGALRVSVESSRRVRITFDGTQRAGAPGLNPFDALIVVQLRRRSAGDGCGTLDGNPLAAFTRWWPGVTDHGRPRSPYDLFDVSGARLLREEHPDLRGGSSVTLRLGRALPKHACAVAYTVVRDERRGTAGSAQLPAFQTSARL